MEKTPENILVVQIGKLGDMVLTSPLLYELKRIFPKASLKVLASTVNHEFVSGLNIADEVILFHKSPFRDFFLAKNLKKNSFDLWIDVKNGYSRTSAALLKIAKPKLSLGFNLEEKVFDVDLKDYVKGKHAVELSLAPIHYFGKEPVHIRPVLNSYINGTPDPQPDLLVNVSSGSKSRYLTELRWITLIGNVLQRYPNIRLHITGIERDSQLILNIEKAFKTEHITSNFSYKLKDLINIINSSRLIITPDTSIVHLASGLNKPVVALYPKVDWNYERFKPLSDDFETVTSNSEKGIADIEADEIFQKFSALYNRISA